MKISLTSELCVRECERLRERRRLETERSVSRQESSARVSWWVKFPPFLTDPTQEQEDTEVESEEPSAEVIAAHRRDWPKVIINVGGRRHEVMWRLLELRPLTRLGMLG